MSHSHIAENLRAPILNYSQAVEQDNLSENEKRLAFALAALERRVAELERLVGVQFNGPFPKGEHTTVITSNGWCDG